MIWNRRTWMGSVLAAMAGAKHAKPLFASEDASPADAADRIGVKTRRCLLLWMDGGPSQFETFDPKAGVITGGPTEAIRTATPGVHFAAGLPRLAALSNDLCVIRTLTSKQGEHERARYLGHTGFERVPAFERPEIGSLFSHRLPASELPGFVSIGAPGYGPAYLGSEHAPLVIENPAESAALMRRLQKRQSRFEVLETLNQDFSKQFIGDSMDVGQTGQWLRSQSRKRVSDRAEQLQRLRGYLQSPLSDLIADADRASEATSNRFATSVKMATDLLAAGVTCVEVSMPGWDTHQDNFGRTSRLTAELDTAMAAAIERLKADGLWEETLLIWAGDFGRTPTINPASGRDHFPAISNMVLGGGGIPGGLVIGKTDALGRVIEDRPVTIADGLATILGRIGIAADETYQTAFGSPTEATDGGTVIPELALLSK
ncbi:MAG: DUF1501 domain-containing protein [Planctomycetota bacterium]